jgi:hypothetical protein
MPVKALPAVGQNASAIQPKPDGAAKKSIQSVLKQYTKLVAGIYLK